jgi:hypothetical protein
MTSCDEYLLTFHYPGFYTQILDTRQPQDCLEGDTKKDQDLALVQLWILADKLIIPELQNLVIDKINEIGEVTKNVPTALLDYAYAETSVESPLRCWFLYNCASPSQIGSLSILNTSLGRCSSNWPLSRAAIRRYKPKFGEWRRPNFEVELAE